MKQLLVATLAALVLGVGVGHMIGSDSKPVVAVDDGSADRAQREIADLKDKIKDLQARLERERRRRSSAHIPEHDPEVDPPTSEPGTEDVSATVQEGVVRDRVAIDQAALQAAELLANRDGEGLWLLGADLLHQGEDGFAKLLELFEWLENADPEIESILDDMFDRHEELFVGRFLRVLADNDEEFLRFGLYLKDVASENGTTGSQIMDGLAGELTDDFGSVLLGFYDGEDTEVLSGYLSWYEENLRGGLDRDSVFGVAQIPTEEATDLLLELAEQKEGHELGWIARALAWKNDPRALDTLRRLEGNVTDPELLRIIRSAITKLESL